MDEFGYLLRRRNRALGLFQKVIRKLQALQTEINNLIASSKGEIEKAKQEIEAHNKKLEYLAATLTDTNTNVENIQKLIGAPAEQISMPV